MPLPRILQRLLWVWAFFFALLAVLLLAGIFLPSVGRAPSPTEEAPQPTVTLTDPRGATETVPVEIAATPERRSIGLMNRPVVTTGMIFVFEEEAPRSFWMKNTLVPLDIAYFRADGSWVSSVHMEPCVEEPCPSYVSAGPAMYALELPAGGLGERIGKGWSLALGPAF